MIHGHSQTVLRSTSHQSEGGGVPGVAMQPGPVGGLVIKETTRAYLRLEFEPRCG